VRREEEGVRKSVGVLPSPIEEEDEESEGEISEEE
jgi:hypothetical protein